MAEELTVLRAAVSHAMELLPRHSPSETFQAEVTNELVSEFQRREELSSRLEGPSVRIRDLLLRSPASRAQWADRLTEATGLLEAELTARQQVDTELVALWTSAARVQDFVLGNVDRPSSLVASISMVAELYESQIDTAATNGVHWGTRSILVATLSHFPELKTELELLRSGQNADLITNQADDLWPLVSAASDSLVLLAPSSVAHDPSNDAGGVVVVVCIVNLLLCKSERPR
jgi:hypothetical protein